MRLVRLANSVYPAGGRCIAFDPGESEGIVGCMLVFENQAAADMWVGEKVHTVALRTQAQAEA